MADWLQVGDRRYPLVGFEDLTINQADELEDACGMPLDELADILQEAADDGERFFSTKRRRMAMRALVWCHCVVAGETLTLEEAGELGGMGSVTVVDDSPPAEEESPDPTAAASDLVAALPDAS